MGQKSGGLPIWDKQQTEAFLQPYGVITHPANALCLEELVNLTDSTNLIPLKTQTESVLI